MVYDDNIEAIKNNRHYLYSKISLNSEMVYKNEVEAVELVKAGDGGDVLEIIYQGKNYYLNSTYSPRHEAKRWANQFAMKNIGTVFVMFGLGNGIFIRELLSRFKEDYILLVYEPSQDIFYKMLNTIDMTDIFTSSKVSVTVEGINNNEISNLLSSNINWMTLKSQQICIHPQYDKIFSDSLKRFDKIVLDSNNRAFANNSTDIVISSKAIENTLRNLKYIKKCNITTDLTGKIPNDVPAIIVSAGPSLDKNIDDLRLAKGKAVIFAVDTAVKYLLAHEILPDFIVTLDPNKSMKHLADERCKYIPLLCRIDSRSENLESNKSKIILFNLEGYVKSIFEVLGKETGNLFSGGSVATGAFSICETIGFNRIILVGQDLAYLGNHTHAGSISVDIGGAGRFLESVEDNMGNIIKTRYDWYVYKKWFEDAIDMFDGEEVINATEGGAKIVGATFLTLKEAIQKHCISSIDCTELVQSLVPTIEEHEIKVLEDMLKNHLTDLDTINVKAREGFEICEKLLIKYEKSIIETDSSKIKNNKLSEINGFIEEKLIYELIDWDIAKATTNDLKDIYVYSEDEKQNKLSTYNKAKVIYEAIQNSAQRIKPMLKDALQAFN